MSMAINSVRTALQLVTGAGELTRAKALEAAAVLAELPGVGETSTRVSQLADELFEAATANQRLVEDLVRGEVDRQLGRLGLVRAGDLDDTRRKIDALDAQVAALREQLATGGAAAAANPAKAKPASRAAVKKAAANTPRAAKKSASRAPTQKKAATKSPAAAKKSASGAPTQKKAATKSTRPRTS